MNTVTPFCGSGTQEFRGKNHLLGRHIPSMTVSIMNFEDAVAVGQFGTSGIRVPTGTAINITPYYSGVQGRRVIAMYNSGGSMILLGPSGMTAQNGYPLPIGTEKAFSIGKALEVWAVASGAASEVRILEIA